MTAANVILAVRGVERSYSELFDGSMKTNVILQDDSQEVLTDLQRDGSSQEVSMACAQSARRSTYE